ncbi:MAG TPA: hypothetical protein P5079_10980 [Elusimicrobiota bacterium]|nr:hypothetical protein [Elusimicrobiota bacterium]
MLLVLGPTALSLAAPSKKKPAARTTAFEESWDFYKWRIEQGDRLEELENILLRIQRKYAKSSVNMTAVERELAAIRSLLDKKRGGPAGKKGMNHESHRP